MKKRRSRIISDFNSFIRRNRKRFLVRQNPKVIWFTGLSGAGKTTVSTALNKEILRKGYFTKIFDGDVIRTGINRDLTYSNEDRMENIRRISEIANLFLDSGLIILCSFISPTNEMREMAKRIIGEERFIEVFVNCPIEVCEKRDVKGLYKKARDGKIKGFTGIDAVYEAPQNPDIEIRTDLWDLKKTTKYVLKQVLPEIKYRKNVQFKPFAGLRG